MWGSPRDASFAGRSGVLRPILAGVGQTTDAARELKHVVVREYVRELLKDAPPGSPAPSERELVQQFKVARMTVRQALDALVGDGLLERMPGRGTFVAHPRREQAQVMGFTEYVARRGRSAGCRTLLARVEQAGPGLARALEVEVGTPVVHWRRVRRADGEVVGVQDVYLNEALVPGLLDVDSVKELPESLYDALDALDLRPTWAEDSVRADLPTDEECTLLELEVASPVLRVARRGVVGGDVVEVSRSAYRSDRFTLYLQLGTDS